MNFLTILFSIVVGISFLNVISSKLALVTHGSFKNRSALTKFHTSNSKIYNIPVDAEMFSEFPLSKSSTKAIFAALGVPMDLTENPHDLLFCSSQVVLSYYKTNQWLCSITPEDTRFWC